MKSHKDPVKNENIRTGNVVSLGRIIYIVALNDKMKHVMRLIPIITSGCTVIASLTFPGEAPGYERIKWLADSLQDLVHRRTMEMLFCPPDVA